MELLLVFGNFSFEIKPGSNIAVPNLTMVATINVIKWAHNPVIVDTDQELCLDLNKLKIEKYSGGYVCSTKWKKWKWYRSNELL